MGARESAGLVDLAEALSEIEASVAERLRGPAGIFAFLEVAADFDVAPDKAIAYFKRKGLQPTFSYADMIGEAHDRAFTVAKLMDVDLLTQVRDSLDSAIANGVPFEQWKREIMPTLQKAGWWGRKEVVDPVSGATMQAQLGSAWRLETIFRTNMQTAYAKGQWAEIEAQADVAPYLMYDAIDDHRTRPTHRARDGTILPIDHPWWRRNFPPLGYGCRCSVIQLSDSDVRGMGLKISAEAPEMPSVEWTNPRTGEPSSWPAGVDPGFGIRPDLVDAQREALRKKIESNFDPAAQAAARSATSEAARSEAVAQSIAIATNEVKTAAATALVLRESKKRAREEEKQVAAQLQLEALADEDAFVKQAIEELSLDPAWRALPAEERLRDAKRRARELQRGA